MGRQLSSKSTPTLSVGVSTYRSIFSDGYRDVTTDEDDVDNDSDSNKDKYRITWIILGMVTCWDWLVSRVYHQKIENNAKSWDTQTPFRSVDHVALITNGIRVEHKVLVTQDSHRSMIPKSSLTATDQTFVCVLHEWMKTRKFDVANSLDFLFRAWLSQPKPPI